MGLSAPWGRKGKQEGRTGKRAGGKVGRRGNRENMGKGEGHTEEKREEEARKRNADTKEDRAPLGRTPGKPVFHPR